MPGPRGPFRDFNSEVDSAPVIDAPTFKLGRDADGEPITWHCVARAPAGSLADMVASLGVDDRGQVSVSNLNIMNFLGDVVVDEDWPAFRALLYGKEQPIPIEVLGKIVMWLTELYVNRPTQAPEPSAPGASTASGTSELGYDSPGSDTPTSEN